MRRGRCCNVAPNCLSTIDVRVATSATSRPGPLGGVRRHLRACCRPICRRSLMLGRRQPRRAFELRLLRHVQGPLPPGKPPPPPGTDRRSSRPCRPCPPTATPASRSSPCPRHPGCCHWGRALDDHRPRWSRRRLRLGVAATCGETERRHCDDHSGQRGGASDRRDADAPAVDFAASSLSSSVHVHLCPFAGRMKLIDGDLERSPAIGRV